MKKIITILLFSFIPVLPFSGQAPIGLPVADIGHIAATIAGHVKSLEQAVKSGVSLGNELKVLEKSYENMKKLQENFEKINRYVYNIQAITEAAENLTFLIQRSSSIYQQVARSGVYDIKELTYIMDFLTSAIQAGTKSVQNIKDFVSADMWRFTDKERLEAIEREAEKGRKARAELEAKMDELSRNIKERKRVEYMNKKGLLDPMESYYVNREKQMTLGAELAYALSMAFGESQEGQTAPVAAKKTTQLYANLKGLFFVLSGFIALIGAFKVYRKVNFGEEALGKTAAIWFGSALTVFLLGSIVELFLF
jgi:microcompartment protein CcmL/EutN